MYTDCVVCLQSLRVHSDCWHDLSSLCASALFALIVTAVAFHGVAMLCFCNSVPIRIVDCALCLRYFVANYCVTLLQYVISYIGLLLLT